MPKNAVEKLIISSKGRVAYALYWQDLLCGGKTMNNYCGSSDCPFDFVINKKIYELHGGTPPIVPDANGKPVVLVGRSGDNCKATQTHPPIYLTNSSLMRSYRSV